MLQPTVQHTRHWQRQCASLLRVSESRVYLLCAAVRALVLVRTTCGHVRAVQMLRINDHSCV